MKGLVLANIDYQTHTSTEGDELQRGLEHAGWTLAGVGYGDGCAHVPTLLERHAPDAVFVQDVRDWSPKSNISFRKDVGFARVDALGLSGLPVFTVVKDAWGWADLQGGFFAAANVAASACYYDEDVVRDAAGGWLDPYPLVRIHHSVDADAIKAMLAERAPRRRGIVTGAVNPHIYPLRTTAFANAARLGIDTRKHPGYQNKRADTPDYLRALCSYKVSVATSAKWAAAFRKIIESVACGCATITTLPAWDVLPEIDGALIRITPDATMRMLKDAIDAAEAAWDEDRAMYWAARALAYYDWRAAGERLSARLCAIAAERMAAHA